MSLARGRLLQFVSAVGYIRPPVSTPACQLTATSTAALPDRRSPAAARQLASRARRRVQGAATTPSRSELSRQRRLASAFLAALRAGDIEALVAVLDTEVVVRLDQAAARAGAPPEIRGARNWAQGAIAFSRAVRFAQPALVDGAVGVVLAPRGRLWRALRFTVTRGKIAEVDIIADPARLRRLDIAVLGE